ncbi:hypothetical protein ACO22_03468 [Paracoccidioides brasiliensis]|uniref:AB hydrolase-1 domain-containing protein n=1 Tax=Paracoccidioides brasiliensis TaxID=121759 RepID=A0A1D2JFY1_PARBR|nr:hypothetical protein ACO22_03468 [Paracoccidioides brasiliensis]
MPTFMDPPPEPLCEFIIPSVYDGIRIDCRLYHPLHLSRPDSALSWKKKGAVVAHPYAPIGGNYDNHIVCWVARELLKVGYIVMTFNFRGAAESEGRTSWTAKPELGDYVSIYGFLICYLLGIDPDFLRDPRAEWETRSSSSGTPESMKESERMQLILAGYSYGSMIVCHLPSIETVLSLFASAAEGTAGAEILQQAEQLSTLWNTGARSELSSQPSTSWSSSDPSYSKPPQLVSLGSSTNSSGKKPQEDPAAAIKQHIERSRRRLRASFVREQEVKNRSSASDPHEILQSMPTPVVSFLLISPILPPITNFITMSLFGSRINLDVTLNGIRVKSTQPEEQLTTHRTLAVYGNNDFFASAKRLRKWFADLTNVPGSMFESLEIDTGGHFWLESGTETQMRTAVREWACKS